MPRHTPYRENVGLECPSCRTQMGHDEVQRMDGQLEGEIRRHYADYWARYQQATYTWFDRGIVKLMAGKHRGEEPR
jgi:hypothetical protein